MTGTSRRYFATLLIHSGASVKRVQRALGHSTLGHSTPAMVDGLDAVVFQR